MTCEINKPEERESWFKQNDWIFLIFAMIGIALVALLLSLIVPGISFYMLAILETALGAFAVFVILHRMTLLSFVICVAVTSTLLFGIPYYRDWILSRSTIVDTKKVQVVTVQKIDNFFRKYYVLDTTGGVFEINMPISRGVDITIKKVKTSDSVLSATLVCNAGACTEVRND